MKKTYILTLTLILAFAAAACTGSAEEAPVSLEENTESQTSDQEAAALSFAGDCASNGGLAFNWDSGYGCDFEGGREDVFCSKDGACGIGWLIDLDVSEGSTESASGNAPESASNDAPVCKVGQPIPVTTVGPHGEAKIKWICPPVYPSDEVKESAYANDTLQVPVFELSSSVLFFRTNNLLEQLQSHPTLQTYAQEKEEEDDEEEDDGCEALDKSTDAACTILDGQRTSFVCNNDSTGGYRFECEFDDGSKAECWGADIGINNIDECTIDPPDKNISENPSDSFNSEAIAEGYTSPHLLVKDPSTCGDTSNDMVTEAQSLYTNIIGWNSGIVELNGASLQVVGPNNGIVGPNSVSYRIVGPNNGVVGPNSGVQDEIFNRTSSDQPIRQGCNAVIFYTKMIAYDNGLVFQTNNVIQSGSCTARSFGEGSSSCTPVRDGLRLGDKKVNEPQSGNNGDGNASGGGGNGQNPANQSGNNDDGNASGGGGNGQNTANQPGSDDNNGDSGWWIPPICKACDPDYNPPTPPSVD